MTGLKIQDYIDLSLITLVKFITEDHTFLTEQWFSNTTQQYSHEKIHKFLSIISLDINNIRNNFIKVDKGRRLASEHNELTPFTNYPLIASSGRLLLTHKNVLFRNIEHYIYDTLNKDNIEKFMNKFGDLFERYIESSLQYSKVKYLTENQIEKALGVTGKQIDFLIQEDNANIFIDAKAVEMNSQGKTTHSSKILRDKTKTSIFKAIEQSHDVIRKIEQKKNAKISERDNNYLLVVTFKELYLGNGSTYYEIIAKEKMDKLYYKYKENTHIPPENMYFITINDLDFLSEILRNKDFKLYEIIERAKRNDANPETRKFDFSMHLNNLGIPLKTPEFLEREKDIIFDRIIDAVSEQ